MKNFKQIAFGLLVGAMAIGFSAFTNAKTFASGDVFVNRDDSGSYNKISAPYNPMDCAADTPPCAYSVTTAGASHVSGTQLTPTQVSTDLANGWIQSEGTNGISAQ